MTRSLLMLLLLPLAATACMREPMPDSAAPPQAAVTGDSAPAAPAPTIVRDVPALERLRGNSGLTLQWISWDYRGQLNVSQPGETVFLQGEQKARDGTGGLVRLQGAVTEIGEDYFNLDGTLIIENAPDAGRSCRLDGAMEFRVTQDRKYWRLRRFEWCDYLTDYIDIYF